MVNNVSETVWLRQSDLLEISEHEGHENCWHEIRARESDFTGVFFNFGFGVKVSHARQFAICFCKIMLEIDTFKLEWVLPLVTLGRDEKINLSTFVSLLASARSLPCSNSTLPSIFSQTVE
jgi:hypothetical protein